MDTRTCGLDKLGTEQPIFWFVDDRSNSWAKAAPNVWNAIQKRALWSTIYRFAQESKNFGDVIDTLSLTVSAKLPDCPKLSILGLSPNTKNAGVQYNKKYIIAVFAVASIYHFEKPRKPSFSKWPGKKSLTLEKLTFTTKGKPDIVSKIWWGIPINV